MNSDRTLAWVQRNRERNRRVPRITEAVERLVGAIEAAGEAVPHGVMKVIAADVDQEFRRVCRLRAGDGRTLIVSVDREGMVYTMRLRWCTVLADALASTPGGKRFGRIVFEYGRSGTRLPEPSGTPG